MSAQGSWYEFSLDNYDLIAGLDEQLISVIETAFKCGYYEGVLDASEEMKDRYIAGIKNIFADIKKVGENNLKEDA